MLSSSLSLLVILLASATTAQDPAAQIITSCSQPDTFALTFDDGPHIYTAKLLATLRAAGAKATFFVNGQNLGQIENYGDVLNQMLCDGHQVASHTYAFFFPTHLITSWADLTLSFSHKDLTTLSEAQMIKEMTDLDDKLLQGSSIGLRPTYMRPPFFNTNDLVLKVMGKLGYKVIHASVDTKDFEHTTEGTNGKAVSNLEQGVRSGGTIALMHDIHSSTVDLLVPKALEILKRANKKAVTVGECLGDAKQNWYSGGSGSPSGKGCGQSKRRSDDDAGEADDTGKNRTEDDRKSSDDKPVGGYAVRQSASGENSTAEA
ncbi:hypothetical protein L249_5227 [Ophiocordyceps polyrhachis-furcata BCC 54312]|uniref:NodB homology domain-containing protein n=1 Tax=Ophiocordyceps polyrhachis-furcata BCC 54312 TaxID=1330021 RepID=A0A367L8Y6_9HYPO|nr:hypothetical protein L249_5227 [Ophiocordyceps polyrhachis-furcata BCC 54312]